MAERDSPPVKRKRKETVFEHYRNTFKSTAKLKESYTSLCNNIANALVPAEITACNAAAGYGVSFSRAACETRLNLGEVYPFGSIFKDGLVILNKLFSDDTYIPEERPTKIVLSKLLGYLTDAKCHNVLRLLEGSRSVDNETQLMMTLAEHFFSRLSVADDYTMDYYVKNKKTQCKCGECKTEQFESHFGDTSIGCSKGWHGALDIVLGSCDVFVDVVTSEEDDSPGGLTSVDVKMKNIEDPSSRSQILAQTIVFSFLQRQRHPKLDNFLIPCIAATSREIKIFFYDSEHDILLESGPIMFLIAGTTEINFQAIIAAWLVLNYKFLCSGPTERVLKAPKSNFFKMSEESYELYKSHLQFTNVVTDEKPCLAFNMLGLLDTKPIFVWPSDVTTKPLE